MIRRVGPMSAAKVGGLFGVFIGLLIGIPISIIALATAATGSASSGFRIGSFDRLLGVGALILLPLFYGAFMFLLGLLYAGIYNIASKWVGGLVIEVAEADRFSKPVS